MVLILGGCTDRMEPAPTNDPVRLAAYILGRPNFDWITITSAHFRTHYLPGSFAERTIGVLIEQNEQSLKTQLAILNEKTYRKRIDLFYFDTRDQIQEMVGQPYRALADAASMAVLAVHCDTLAARDAHEIMHVVSFDLWGGWERRNSLAWLHEGLATYAGGPCNGYEISELAAHMLKNTPDTVPLDSLVQNFRSYPEMIGYILMESFVRFVIDEYGLGLLRELWTQGGEGVERAFGKDMAVIEQEWHSYVSRLYPNPAVNNWEYVKENGCK